MKYFRQVSGAIDTSDPVLRKELLQASRNLIRPFLDNTHFQRGWLSLPFLYDVPAYTIFSRREKGDVPYLLLDLVSDISSDAVSRLTIDERTESVIRSLANSIAGLPSTPFPVIVEDCAREHCLILEGNKRLTAAALADRDLSGWVLEAYIGRTSMSWQKMLAIFGMKASCPPVA